MFEIIDSAKVTKAGAYRMSAGEYHGDPCPKPSLSSSVARILLDASPAHAFHAHPRLNPNFQPDDGNRRLAVGEACHALLIGRGAQIANIDFDSYRKDAAKEARDAALERGEIPILATDLQLANEIVSAARRQLPSEILRANGDGEVVVAAEIDGAWCRVMLDWWSEERRDVVDYKTTIGRATEAAFSRQAGQMGYDVQDAFYQRVIREAFPQLAGRTRFLFVVQEIEPPYALATFEISEADRYVADRKVSAAIYGWRSCLEADRWPGYPSGVQRITLPEWHSRRWLDAELNGDEPSAAWALAGGER